MKIVNKNPCSYYVKVSQHYVNLIIWDELWIKTRKTLKRWISHAKIQTGLLVKKVYISSEGMDR